jgi:hypothetical protein
MAVGSGSGGINGGYEVLENGSERHPYGACDGISFGVLSGAVEPDITIRVCRLLEGASTLAGFVEPRSRGLEGEHKRDQCKQVSQFLGVTV